MTDQEFPRPEPGDSDDVVLALTTAGSLWANGEKAEAVRWLRKAQEGADAAGHDERSLALARAAAELSDVSEPASDASEPAQDASEAAPEAPLAVSEAAPAEDEHQEVKPQLTKPPMPPASPKTRLETPRAKSGANGSPNGARALSEGNGMSTGDHGDGEHGPVLTQVLRVCIKRSLRDDELFVARLLEDGEVPAGYQEALVVLTDPEQDLLDKLS